MEVMNDSSQPFNGNGRKSFAMQVSDHIAQTRPQSLDMTSTEACPLPEHPSRIIASPRDPCPPPPSWPPWPPLSRRGDTSIPREAMEKLLNPHTTVLSPDSIPPGWANDWIRYKHLRRWNGHYGSMQWYFRDVLHLSGEVRPVVFSDENHYSSDDDNEAERSGRTRPRRWVVYQPGSVPTVVSRSTVPLNISIEEILVGEILLVEIQGMYFIHFHESQETRPLNGVHSLKDALIGLATQTLDLGEILEPDDNEIVVHDMWLYTAAASRCPDNPFSLFE